MAQQAQTKSIPDPRPDSSDPDTGDSLGGRSVLELLEADISNHENYRRLVGIRNGLAIGALLWLLLIVAVVIAT